MRVISNQLADEFLAVQDIYGVTKRLNDPVSFPESIIIEEIQLSLFFNENDIITTFCDLSMRSADISEPA